MVSAASYGVRRPALLLAAAIPLATGCYSYRTAQAGSVSPGETVRARITPAAGEQVAPLVGNAARVLTGKLISDSSGAVILEVPSVRQADVGGVLQTLHQRVALARSDVIEWEIRKLDRGRTAALAGAVAVAVGVVLIKSFNSERGNGGTPGGGGSDALVPVLRISHE